MLGTSPLVLGIVRCFCPTIRPLKWVCRLVAGFLFMAMLIFPADAETPPSPNAQPDGLIEWGHNGSAPAAASTQQATDGLIEWGDNSSPPPEGSSVSPSGNPISGSAEQQGTTTPATQTESRPPNAPAEAESSPPSASQNAATKILVVIDKPSQEMKVFIDNVERFTWEVSTGLRGYDTPSGKYTARSMNEIWYSKQWDDAPMPHAIFFTEKGHAVHGTNETKNLGKPASHGCVRLAPENARTLFALVKEKGLANTEIVLNGDTPKAEAKVASAGARQQHLNGKRRSGALKAASSRTHKQEMKRSRQFVERRFDPRELEKARRFARRDWARVYGYGPPGLLPPSGYYQAPPSRRFFIPDY